MNTKLLHSTEIPKINKDAKRYRAETWEGHLMGWWGTDYDTFNEAKEDFDRHHYIERLIIDNYTSKVLDHHF